MEIKRNIKYFTFKGLSPLIIIGIALFALGIILAAVPFDLQSLGVILMLASCVVFVFGFSGSAGENDIDNQIEGKLKDIQEIAMIKLDVNTKKFLTIISPYLLRGFDFRNDKDNLYFKRGTDGKNRTNIYNAVQLFFTKDKILIYSKHFSLTDANIDDENTASILYTDMGKAEVLEKFFMTDKNKKVVYHLFQLIDLNGNEVISLPVEYGADVDKAVEDINHVIDVRKKDSIKEEEVKAEKRAELHKRIEEERKSKLKEKSNN